MNTNKDTTMNTQTTLPEQLRLAAEIIEKKLPWEYTSEFLYHKWHLAKSDVRIERAISDGFTIRLAQPPAPSSTPPTGYEFASREDLASLPPETLWFVVGAPNGTWAPIPENIVGTDASEDTVFNYAVPVQPSQPPAPEVAHGIASAYLDAKGWCLFDAEGTLVESWPMGWEDKLITAQFLRAKNIYIANSRPDDADKPAPEVAQDPYAKLKAAQKRKARIRVFWEDTQTWGGWQRTDAWTWKYPPERYEIHPDDADKPDFDLAAHVQANGFRALVDGEQFHREDWTAEMLPAGTRPLLLNEKPDLHFDKVVVGFEEFTPSIDARTNAMNHTRTTRPLPDLPTSTHGKSLGQVAYEAFHGKTQEQSNDWHQSMSRLMWDRAAQAVAAEVSRLHAEEVETKDDVIKSLELTLRSVREHRDNAISRAESAEKRVEALEASRALQIQLRADAEKLIAEQGVRIEQAKARATLRPISEAGDVPEGCVRIRLKVLPDQSYYIDPSDGITHFCDIQFPIDTSKKEEDGPAWIEHDGGECPLRDEEVEEWEVKFRDDKICPAAISIPSKCIWSHANDDADITHYRVIKWKPGYTATTITGPDGKVYTRHKPGDAIPCDGNANIETVCRDGLIAQGPANKFGWGKHLEEGVDITGYRYADAEPKAETVPLEAKTETPLIAILTVDDIPIGWTSNIAFASFWSDQLEGRGCVLKREFKIPDDSRFWEQNNEFNKRYLSKQH